MYSEVLSSRVVFLIVIFKDALGHQPEWTWRFGDSDFMRCYFSAQVLLFRSPPQFSTLGLAVSRSVAPAAAQQTRHILRVYKTMCANPLTIETVELIFTLYQHNTLMPTLRHRICTLCTVHCTTAHQGRIAYQQTCPNTAPQCLFD